MSTSEGGPSSSRESYKEYEIRTIAADSRKYHAAKFQAPLKDSAGAAAPVVGERKEVPDFKNEVKPPVYMRYEEIPPPPDVKPATEEEQEEEEENKFKRHRRYFHRKQFRWVIEDRNRKPIYYGTEEGGQSSNYVVLIPPSAPGAPFYMVPVDKWYSFRKPPNYKVLTLDKAEEIFTQTRNVSTKKLDKLLKKIKDEESEHQNTQNLASLDDDDTKAEDSTDWFHADQDIGSSRRNTVKDILEGANEQGEAAPEDDTEEIAIDRMAREGAGGGDDFADYDEEFDDDEDDQGELAAEEAREDEEGLIQGAEEVREAAEGESGADEDEEELDEEMINEETVDDLNNAEAALALDGGDDDEQQRMVNFTQKYYRPLQGRAKRNANKGTKRKIDSENKESVAGTTKGSMSSPATPSPEQVHEMTTQNISSKPATPEEKNIAKRPRVEAEKSLKTAVVETMRLNRGRMKTKALVKALKQQGFKMSSADIKAQFKSIIVELCTIEDDVVHGKQLVLKT